MSGLSDADRGQQLSGRLPGPARRLARRYADWNWGWRADIALRYVPVEAALRRVGWPAGRARILDVGCGSKGGLTSYAPVRTVGVDLSFNVGRIRRHPRVTPVVGSGLALPVGDGTFDVVLCMDTLEHLAPAERTRLVEELFRAVQPAGLVICGAPCGPQARAAEERLNAEFRARSGRDHPWLAEHLAYEPLSRDGLRDLMAGAAARRLPKYSLDLVGNTNLALWERLQRERLLRHLHRPLYRPLWPLLRDRHRPPVYRQVCIVQGSKRGLRG